MTAAKMKHTHKNKHTEFKAKLTGLHVSVAPAIGSVNRAGSLLLSIKCHSNPNMQESEIIDCIKCGCRLHDVPLWCYLVLCYSSISYASWFELYSYQRLPINRDNTHHTYGITPYTVYIQVHKQEDPLSRFGL